MITDPITDIVYVSSLLLNRFPEVYTALSSILSAEEIPLVELINTRDIWCRDYMPLQRSGQEFLQFVYQPDYLRRYPKLRTLPKDAYPEFLQKAKGSDIVLDGGNVVKSRNKVIITQKVIDENSRYSKEDLVSILRKELGVEQIVLIPPVPGEMTGHSDGLVRFVDEQTVLLNDMRHPPFQRYFETLKEALVNQGLTVRLFPWDAWKNKRDSDDTGDYINFLQVGKLIVLPAFYTPTDEMAKAVIQQHFRDNRIYSIDCRRLAKEGGLLHCCTWNIQSTIPKHYL